MTSEVILPLTAQQTVRRTQRGPPDAPRFAARHAKDHAAPQTPHNASEGRLLDMQAQRYLRHGPIVPSSQPDSPFVRTECRPPYASLTRICRTC